MSITLSWTNSTTTSIPEKDRSYWMQLDLQMRAFCEVEGLPYVRNDDTVRSRHGEPPVVVNYFFHEEIVNRGK